METTDLRHKSRTILEGRDRAPARSFLKGMGFSEEDLTKPIVGVAHSWIETMPWRSPPANDPRKGEVCVEAGRMVMDLLHRGLTPKDILTREAFENAIAAGAATGGSTNLVLHLLAIAREAGIPLDINDFDRVSERTPIIADLKPGGRYTAVALDRAGGTKLLGRRLVEAALVDGGQLTPTGRTIAEEVEGAEEAPGQDVVVSVESPL